MAQAAVGQMIHRATIERDGATGATDWNGEPAPVFAAHLSDVKCFAWSQSRKEVLDAEKTTVLETLRCIMPLSTDVIEEDQISVIANRVGTTLLAGPLRIESIQRVHTHLELILQRVLS